LQQGYIEILINHIIHKKIRVSRLVYAALGIVAAITIYLASYFPEADLPGDIGPAAFPAGVAKALIVLISLELILSRKNDTRITLKELAPSIFALFIYAVTVWLITQFGYFTVLPLALFIGLRLLGAKNYLINCIYSLSLTGLIWIIFDHYLLIPITKLGH